MWSWKFIISFKFIVTALRSYPSTNIVEGSSAEPRRTEFSRVIIISCTWLFLIRSLERNVRNLPCNCSQCSCQRSFEDVTRFNAPALPKSRDMNSLRNRRLLNEFHKLNSSINSEWLVEQYYPNDLSRWKVSINGRPGTRYENGIFRLSVTFPSNYPFEPPDFRFHTLIFHPWIDNQAGMSKLCLRNYTLSVPICELLHDIITAIHDADVEVAPSEDAISLYNSSLTLAQRQAALRTFRYISKAKTISDEPLSCPSSDLVSD